MATENLVILVGIVLVLGVIFMVSKARRTKRPTPKKPLGERPPANGKDGRKIP